MGKKRPNQDVVTFYAPEGLKEKYRRVCAIRGTSMTKKLVAHMEEEVEKNQELLDMVEGKLEEG